jgi:putative hemolysin
LLLLVCSAFFSSAEVAFFSLDVMRLRRVEAGDRAAAQQLRHILSTPARLLSTILIGNTLVNVCASVVGYLIILRLHPHHAEEISVAVMTLLLLIFGEIAPKRLAMLYPQQMSILYSAPLKLIMVVATPLRRVLEYITRTLARHFIPQGQHLTEEEFESMVDLSGEDGALDDDECQMVKSIIRLEDLRASDVMTPRVDIIGIDLEDPPRDITAFVRNSKMPRLILYREHLDQADGFLDVQAFLLDPEHELMNAWIPPLYVPETAPLDKLLSQFQHQHRRAAIVVDEYGGTAGLVTRSDILEEITGDMNEDLAEHRLRIERIGTARWLVDGAINLEDINDELGFDLAEEGVDRIAGWVIAQLGHLPRAGESVAAQQCRATVQRMRKHRIELLLLEKITADEEEARTS